MRNKLTGAGIVAGCAVVAAVALHVVAPAGPSTLAVADVADPNPATDPGAVTITLPDDETTGPPPVSAREHRRAVAVAGSAPELAQTFRAPHELVLVRVLDGEVCPARRCIDLTYYLYPSNRVLDVVVETDRWRVSGTSLTTGQPPLSESEIARAHSIADRDADLRRHLGRAAHSHPVPAYPMWRDVAPCDVDRCASVVYPLDRMITQGHGRQATIVVDLNTGKVVERLYVVCSPGCEPGWS